MHTYYGIGFILRTLKVFLELLIEELSGSNPFEEKSGEPDDDDKVEEVPVKKKRSSTWADEESRLRKGAHNPLKVSCSKPNERGTCLVCSTDGKIKRSFVKGTKMHYLIEQYYNKIEDVDDGSIEFSHFKKYLDDFSDLKPYRTVSYRMDSFLFKI